MTLKHGFGNCGCTTRAAVRLADFPGARCHKFNTQAR
jgi:hypothetical protein